jgi:hypothetical protein
MHLAKHPLVLLKTLSSHQYAQKRGVGGVVQRILAAKQEWVVPEVWVWVDDNNIEEQGGWDGGEDFLEEIQCFVVVFR